MNKNVKSPGSSTESPMGECSFESFNSEADGGGGGGGGGGVFGEKEEREVEVDGPANDGGAEEIRRVDEEIESKVSDGCADIRKDKIGGQAGRHKQAGRQTDR